SGRYDYRSQTGLGRSGAPRYSLGNHADGRWDVHYCRGRERRARVELGRLLPDCGETCMLGVL
ncbi:hypothetical protein A2U01_0096088, partial [Trifolium medium]|nr:hypothetical protein [Trifolium medium]